MKQTRQIRVIAIAALVIASLASVASASAAPVTASENQTATTNVQSVSKACLDALKLDAQRSGKTYDPGICDRKVSTVMTLPRVVTLEDLQAVSATFSSEDFASIKTSAAAGIVRSRNFYQQISSVFSTVSQTGVFYYDGNRAWISTYRGFAGSQRCQVERSVILSVAPQNCYESGTLSVRTLSQQWLFTLGLSVEFVSLPISWSETYSLRANAAGATW